MTQAADRRKIRRHGLLIRNSTQAVFSVTRVAEDDTRTTSGLELRAQRVRLLPAAFGDPDDEPRGRPPLRVEDQRQPLAQNGVVPAPQLLVGGKHAAFGPGAGKLDSPRSPRRIGLQVATTLRTVDQQLGELHAARADCRV